MPYKNREDKRRFDRANAHKRRILLYEIKSHPCKDCGNIYPPECMDFDHLYDKKFTIGRVLTRKWETILAEIEKCDIVCSNCHRIRTEKRKAMVGLD